MKSSEIAQKIAKKNFNIDAFVDIAIENEEVRNTIIHHMLTHADIMVYYHCYYVVEKASRLEPEVFYPYWYEIADLLNHKNSYHRDFALDILGNLAKVDEEHRFPEIQDAYFNLINDEKFMTGHCCVKNLVKIYRHKAELRERIVGTLLNIDDHCDYTEKQIGVLKADILDIFDEIYEQDPEQSAINTFIRAEANCISPKTRKRARELIRKYHL